LRRIALYRGVFPVLFDAPPARGDDLYKQLFERLLELRKVEEGDLVVFTKGDMRGVAGGTNAMTILRVTDQ
jgi:pyruvate kinase